MEQRKYFTADQSAEFLERVFDDRVEVNCVRLISDVAVECTITAKDDFVDALPNTSEVVAAFVTCWARLKLYDCLDLLQERVHYMDTDRCLAPFLHIPFLHSTYLLIAYEPYLHTYLISFSIIFLQRDEDDPLPPTGCFLGELTNELTKPYGEGSYITEFCSGGPKQYCYTVVTPSGEEKRTLKAKGITLNFNALNVLNYESMKESVLSFLDGEDDDGRRVINYQQIRKHPVGPKVLTVNAVKSHRVVYDKRVLRNGTTYPFGY